MVLNRRPVRIALWIGVIGMMALIFLMSAQTGEDSLSISDFLVLPILRLIGWIIPDMSPETYDSLYWTLQTIVRKGAHMTEYALLAFFIRLLLTSYDWRHAALWGWIFAVVYAATDEMHQSLVAARTAQFTDVLVDGAGALLGIVVAWIVVRAILWKAK